MVIWTNSHQAFFEKSVKHIFLVNNIQQIVVSTKGERGNSELPIHGIHADAYLE